MESSLSDSGLIKLDDDNQMLIFIGNMFYSAFDVVVNFSIVTIHYLFLPVVLMYSFCAHAQEQMWKITKHILFELYELTKIVPLTFEAYFWSTRCFLEALFISKSKGEIAAEVEQNIYKPLKKILRLLKALPFSYSHATSLYTILNQLPIFGEGRLPFPNFLFEDTFKKIDFQKGTVSIILPPSEDLSQSTIEPLTSTETPSSIEASNTESALAVGQSKPAIFKRKPTKSDDEVKLDSSVNQRTTETDVKSARSF